jgi:hypothetical protein
MAASDTDRCLIRRYLKLKTYIFHMDMAVLAVLQTLVEGRARHILWGPTIDRFLNSFLTVPWLVSMERVSL